MAVQPSPTPAPEAPTPEAAAPTLSPTPSVTPEVTAAVTQATPVPMAQEPALVAPVEAAPVASPTAPTLAEPSFEGLVDQVEESLKTTPAAVTNIPAVDAVATPPETSTTGATEPTIEKSDADLVAEFEKMLNG